MSSLGCYININEYVDTELPIIMFCFRMKVALVAEKYQRESDIYIHRFAENTIQNEFEKSRMQQAPVFCNLLGIKFSR